MRGAIDWSNSTLMISGIFCHSLRYHILNLILVLKNMYVLSNKEAEAIRHILPDKENFQSSSPSAFHDLQYSLNLPLPRILSVHCNSPETQNLITLVKWHHLIFNKPLIYQFGSQAMPFNIRRMILFIRYNSALLLLCIQATWSNFPLTLAISNNRLRS